MIFVPDVFLFFHIQIYLKHHCLSKRQKLNPQKYIASTWRHIISCKFIENRCFSECRKHQFTVSQSHLNHACHQNLICPEIPTTHTAHCTGPSTMLAKDFDVRWKKIQARLVILYTFMITCYMNSPPSPMHSRIISSHIKSWSQTENAIRSI